MGFDIWSATNNMDLSGCELHYPHHLAASAHASQLLDLVQVGRSISGIPEENRQYPERAAITTCGNSSHKLFRKKSPVAVDKMASTFVAAYLLSDT